MTQLDEAKEMQRLLMKLVGHTLENEPEEADKVINEITYLYAEAIALLQEIATILEKNQTADEDGKHYYNCMVCGGNKEVGEALVVIQTFLDKHREPSMENV